MDWTLDTWGARGRFVLIFLAAVTIVLVVGMIVLVYAHRRWHPYWRTQPVGWMTVFPSASGVIDPAHTARTHALRALPPSYRIDALPLPSSAGGDAARAVAVAPLVTLMNTHGEVPYVMEADRLAWMLRVPGSRTYVLRKRSQIVGMIHSAPLSLDTPRHAGLPCRYIDHLVLAPSERGQSLSTHLIDRVIRDAPPSSSSSSSSSPSASVPAVGAFMSERRMPWPEAAMFRRSSAVINPVLLPEVPLEVRVREVRRAADLPTRALESSTVRVENGQTLEPTPDAARWRYLVANPYHIVLSVSGEDWIHFEELPMHVASAASTTRTEAIAAQVAYDGATRVLVLRGFSLPRAQLARYVVAYLRQSSRPRRHAPSANGDGDGEDEALVLIVPSPLLTELQPALEGALATTWDTYDEQCLYLYNYRVNKYEVHVPFSWNVGHG